ncbi:GNAT family N-acetyltransferase [uncultured Croceitalea sp.]|uniref:GNAT family N-acetyltransferase n=1 Tax=uncultured Croceitalea sp. TaxID=1798908 RepID=UPI003305B3DB
MNHTIKNIILNGKSYGFISDFKHDKQLRTSFNNLTEATFGFNFEEWYLNGYWTENYIAYALLYEQKIVSNVSVSVIEFFIEEERKTGIQIGTVMTDKKFQNRGLNRFIMEQVLAIWQEQSDFVYLFANDSVLNFYPKFNFEIVYEYQYSKLIDPSNDITAIKKLNIDNAKDKELLIETIQLSKPISKLSMFYNTALIMFYCLSFKKDSIYYSKTLKAIIIADFENEAVSINAVFSKEHVDVNNVIKVMSFNGAKQAILGFTPLNVEGFDRSIVKEADTLFILNDKIDIFKDKYWMFPVLSHA